MQVPLQITFRHMEPSNAVEAIIREQCHKLEQFAEHITCCRITIDAPSGHHRAVHAGAVRRGHGAIDLDRP